MAKERYSWMAILSFILSIIIILIIYLFHGTILFGYILPILVTLLAIIFGILGLIQIKKNKKLKGKILAWIGLILGFVWAILIIRGLFTPIVGELF